MAKKYLNPKELFPSLQFGFSQIVVSQGGKPVYLSGQAAGGTLADIVSMRIYVVKEKLGEMEAISAALKKFFPAERAPATTWVGVHALANSDFLIEIEAIGSVE